MFHLYFYYFNTLFTIFVLRRHFKKVNAFNSKLINHFKKHIQKY